MSDHMNAPSAPDRLPDPRPAGPARDFAAFCELDLERRRNSDDDFDPDLFDEAVALVLGRFDPGSVHSSTPNSAPGPAADRP
jgi:hypothetical protein